MFNVKLNRGQKRFTIARRSEAPIAMFQFAAVGIKQFSIIIYICLQLMGEEDVYYYR
jgi:hypothetical protein